MFWLISHRFTENSQKLQGDYLNQFNTLILAKFSCLIAFLPLEIYTVFQLARFPSQYFLFGGSMLAPLLLEFLIQPYISHVLDQYSRRNLQSLNEAVFMVILAVFIALIVDSEIEPVMFYVAIYEVIEIYSYLTWQSFIALGQGVVTKDMYGKYNGVSEAIGQLPVLTGALLSGAMILFMGVLAIFTIALVMTGISLILLRLLNENFDRTVYTRRLGVAGDYIESFRYMKSHLRPILFIFLLNVPFIAIIAGNFLKPVFIASVIAGNASTLAFSESVYAFMAIIAGLIVPVINERIKPMHSVYIYAVIFFAGSFLMPVFPYIGPYLAFQMLHGFGNPGVRITRNTMLMSSVPNGEIGKFNGSVSLLTLIGRFALLTTCVLAVGVVGAPFLLFAIGLIVLAAVFASSLFLKNVPSVGEYFSINSIKDISKGERKITG